MTPAQTSTNDSNAVNSLPVADATSASGCQLNADGSGHACSCPMHRAIWGLTAAIAGMIAVAIGGLAWYTYHTSRSTEVSSSAAIQWPSSIDATAAVSSEKYSIATGLVGEEAEGFFVLDHNSGLLQCKVLYPRMRAFMANFTVNVGDALGAAGKGGSYLMVTGQADFMRSSNVPVATTVVYVLNTSTGAYAAYAIPFNRVLVNSGQPQTGQLILIGADQANPIVDRDAVP